MKVVAKVLATCLVAAALGTISAPAADLPAGGGQEVSREARDAFTLAMENHKAKKLDSAIDEFMRAYSADARILTFDDQGLLDAALASLLQRLAANPSELNLNFKLAEINNLKGYVEESLKYYRQVLKLAPQSPQAAIAREETRKLEASITAGRAAAVAAQAAASQATTQTATANGPVNVIPSSPSPDESAATKIQQLQEELQKAKEENDQTKEKLEKLQKDYDELNVKTQKYYFYYTRFFSDPKNVQNLQGGK